MVASAMPQTNRASDYERGDYVKLEFTDEISNESEWMWIILHSWDCDAGLIFGTLDNQPVLTEKLKLGQRIAARFDTIVEHRKACSFA